MYWYQFSSFIYASIHFQAFEKCSWTQVLLQLHLTCAGNKSGACTTESFCDRPKVRYPVFWQRKKKNKCPNQQDPWVIAVVMEGKMQLSSWGISACFIFWGPYKKFSVSMIGTGNYFSFIIIPLGLGLTHYHYTLHLPRLMKKKKKELSCMLWIMLIHEIEGRKNSKMYFNSVSVPWGKE